MKLKLYCADIQIPSSVDHVQLLDPFWGFQRWDPTGEIESVFQRYRGEASQIFEIVSSIEEADAGLIPVDWNHVSNDNDTLYKARRFIETMDENGKKTFIFFITDAPVQLEWPRNVIVLRIASHRRLRQQCEFVIPQWSRDYVEQDFGGMLHLREKSDIPCVGFCGYAPPLGMKPGALRLKEKGRLALHYLGAHHFLPFRMAHAARARALIALSQSPFVETNFVIRDQSAFNNPIGMFLPGGSLEQLDSYRRDFANNIIQSDYILCSRGYANCSIRLFETLSLARIPILIDTDVVLPYEVAIDWNKYCIFVKESNIASIGRRVKEFHDNLSEERFKKLQIACRDLYEQWLSPNGFFNHLHLLCGVNNPSK
jgi:hypothetical protein